MIAIYAYLLLCAAVFVAGFAIGAYEDLTRGPDHKFGYNIGLPWKSFYMMLLCLVSCPVINLIVASVMYWPSRKRK